MSFENLGLMAELLRNIAAEGYTSPTPIQSQAIPFVLEGRDVLAGAQTGTGKTAAFALPILQLLTQTPRTSAAGPPRVLVLTPTRELAAQVGESFTTYGKGSRLRTTTVYGGVGLKPQIDTLARGVEILVATPGRLLDLARQGHAKLGSIEILVLDEADRMLDMGFIHDIRAILKMIPRERQNLLFSATYTDEIRQLTERLLHNPALVEVARRNTAAETVKQFVYRVDKNDKRALLATLITEEQWYQVLVFTRTKHGANRLAEQLNRSGIEASAIHGNKSQGARTRALGGFKDGSIRVLVATDIAARGLDIDRLPQVVNFELPNVPEDYVHRIGRTGRAGEEGSAISLVSADERKFLSGIERLLGKSLPVLRAPTLLHTNVSASSSAPERANGNVARPQSQSGAGQNDSRPGNGRRRHSPTTADVSANQRKHRPRRRQTQSSSER